VDLTKMSGRHRDVGRTFASGSAKRKDKEDKEKSKEEALSKMRKISQFFPSSDSTEIQGATSLQPIVMPTSITASASCEDVEVPTNNAATNADAHGPKFSTDIGAWPEKQSNEVCDYWISKGTLYYINSYFLQFQL
jgi:hypothetical protein